MSEYQKLQFKKNLKSNRNAVRVIIYKIKLTSAPTLIDFPKELCTMCIPFIRQMTDVGQEGINMWNVFYQQFL